MLPTFRVNTGTLEKGSGKYRAILHKQQNPKDLHSPSNWRSRLDDPTITSTHVKQSRKNLTSRYLGSDTADTLSRLKLGKTYFGTQLYHVDSSNSTLCKTCLRETQTEVEEDLVHATFSCPHTYETLQAIAHKYFPGQDFNFTHKNILLSVTEDLHPLYTGKPGQLLNSLVWDFTLCYLMNCRSKEKTPIPEIAIKHIQEGISRILSLLPKTLVAKHISNSPELCNIFK